MKKKQSAKHDCYTLTQEMLKAMKDDGYSCSHHYYIFSALVRFCKKSYAGYYSTDAGASFLAYKREYVKSKEHVHAKYTLKIKLVYACSRHYLY